MSKGEKKEERGGASPSDESKGRPEGRPFCSLAVPAPDGAQNARSRRYAKWGLMLPPVPTVSCPSLRRTWAVRSAPALTASSAGAAAAGLAHFHGTFASASISALPGLLVCTAGPFRSTRSASARKACACRLVVLVGALAPSPSPWRPCLRGTAHGCGLAFQPLGCCPCHCAQSIPVKVLPVASGAEMLCGTSVPSVSGPGVSPCPWRFGWRFSLDWRSFPASIRPGFHPSVRFTFTGPPAPPFADFNSHPKGGVTIFNGGNRFIALAFLPPSIPDYR